MLLAILGLGWVGVWLSCDCIIHELVDRGSWTGDGMVGGDLFLIDLLDVKLE